MTKDEIAKVHDVMLENFDKYPELLFRLPWACRVRTNTGAEITKWFRTFNEMWKYWPDSDPEIQEYHGAFNSDYFGYDPVSGTMSTCIVNMFRDG